MKNALAFFGAAVLILMAVGMLGVGHFQMSYGPEELECKKITTLTQF